MIIIKALEKIFLFNNEIYKIAFLSIKISLSSIILSLIISLPLSILISRKKFTGKKIFLILLHSCLSIPTVFVGLIVYSFVTSKGLFGNYQLLYTPYAIIIGQTILITPLLLTLLIESFKNLNANLEKTAITLGAGKKDLILLYLIEAKPAIIAAVLAAFGRAISEVGISIIVGGNIRGYTRVLTTAIALEYDQGDFSMSLGLGFLLLLISIGINIILHVFHKEPYL